MCCILNSVALVDMDMDMEDLRAGRGIAPCPTRVENHPSPASNFWEFSPVHNVQGARQYYVLGLRGRLRGGQDFGLRSN